MPSKTNNETPALRTMPESLAAEAAVLGSMLIDPECVPEVTETLSSDSFFRMENHIIFDALRALYDKSGVSGVDAVLLREELVVRGELDDAGGVEYIAKILDSVPSSANCEYYAQVVNDKFVLRQLISVTGDILDNAYSQETEPRCLLDRAEADIFKIAESELRNEGEHIGPKVKERCEAVLSGKYLEVRGLPTGFTELDDLTCGFQDGDMVVIAARPSMGKTTLALNIVDRISVADKKPVAFFSLEMSGQQLAERLLIMTAAIDGNRFRKGMLDDKEKLAIGQACTLLEDSGIYIDDTGSLDPMALRSKARRLKQRYGICCVIVDYMQLMHVQFKKVDSRQQEITLISRYIKSLARELDIPVIVMSQLNRVPEQRTSHIPRMSDLRESGSIEQDADVVMLIHREDYYHKMDRNYVPDNIVSLIIAKQRCGPTGSVKLVFDESLARFKTCSYVPDSEIERPF